MKYKYKLREPSRDIYGRTMPFSTTRHYVVESDTKLSKEELHGLEMSGDGLALDDCVHCYVGDKDAYIHYVGIGHVGDSKADACIEKGVW